MASGHIRFVHRPMFDVIVAYVHWHLETESDVLAWAAAYRDYLGPLKRKVDLILELSKFQLNPKIAKAYARERAEILGSFTTRSYRVRQPREARTLMYTESVLRGTPANHFSTIDEALKALLEDRAKEAAAPKRGSPPSRPDGTDCR